MTFKEIRTYAKIQAMRYENALKADRGAESATIENAVIEKVGGYVGGAPAFLMEYFNYSQQRKNLYLAKCFTLAMRSRGYVTRVEHLCKNGRA